MLTSPTPQNSLFQTPIVAPVVVPPRKGRVLHLINGEHYAGAERVQDLLAMRLGEFGYDVGFACVKSGKFGAMRRSTEAPLYEFNMQSRFDLRPVRLLSRLIRKEGYTLLHTHTARTAMIGRPAAALARVPMVHHIHGQTATEVHDQWISRLSALTERVSLGGAAGVVAVSKTALEYLRRQGLPESRITLVPNGVPAKDQLTPRQAPTQTWTVGTAALFRPRKGLEVLLEAIAWLRSDSVPVTLRAVGGFETEEYHRQIMRMVEELKLEDAVTWTGFQRDVDAQLARMDLFVLPSLIAEGLPMVILEAMASGVPVIGSRVPGVVDVVEDRRTGLLVDPGNADDLARAIVDVVHGEIDWQQLRGEAHRIQHQSYSDRSMARGVAELYDRILAV